MLARYGIRATRERPVGSAREAVMAAREIGWPVALKGFGPDIVHKSDEGAVALALGDETQLQTAWDLMARRLGTRLRGALVAEMARGEAEAILGIQHDRQFGPVVLVGLGGILAELIDDVVLIPAPVSPERVRALLPRLRLWPLLQGVRGGPALDVEGSPMPPRGCPGWRSMPARTWPNSTSTRCSCAAAAKASSRSMHGRGWRPEPGPVQVTR